jgi:hypothetical protein
MNKNKGKNFIANWEEISSGYGMFLNLSLASSLIITLFGFVVSMLFFDLLGDSEPIFHYGIPTIIILPSIILLLCFLNLLFSAISLYPGYRFLDVFCLRIFFTLTNIIKPVLRVDTLVLYKSFIALNNRIVRNKFTPTLEEKTLILVPHCLQNPQCSRRLVGDINNCEACGGCEMGIFKEIKENSSINIEVVPGGTLAREIVLRNNPKMIVAVACERELTFGIMDTLPHLVFGVINERPSGYCTNTCVDMGFVKWLIEYVRTGLFKVGVNE